MRTIIPVFVFAALALAQPRITLTALPARVGTTATVTVTLAGSAGSAMVASQWSLIGLPAGAAVVAGPAVTTVSKTVTCGTLPVITCVVYGGVSVLADGVLATVTFPAPTSFTATAGELLLGVNAAGDSPGIAIAGGPALIFTAQPALSACDVNGDGKIDLLDVRNVSDQIDGVIPSTTDLNGDGKTNIIDLQRVVNAVADGVCRVGA